MPSNRPMPVRSGEPFYDALYYQGSTEAAESFRLYDYHIGSLTECPPLRELSAESHRALLLRGIGCLTLEVKLRAAPTEEHYYISVRPDDLSETGGMLKRSALDRSVAALVQDPGQPITVRLEPYTQGGPSFSLVAEPLRHPHLREIYDEIVGTLPPP